MGLLRLQHLQTSTSFFFNFPIKFLISPNKPRRQENFPKTAGFSHPSTMSPGQPKALASPDPAGQQEEPA